MTAHIKKQKNRAGKPSKPNLYGSKSDKQGSQSQMGNGQENDQQSQKNRDHEPG